MRWVWHHFLWILDDVLVHLHCICIIRKPPWEMLCFILNMLSDETKTNANECCCAIHCYGFDLNKVKATSHSRKTTLKLWYNTDTQFPGGANYRVVFTLYIPIYLHWSKKCGTQHAQQDGNPLGTNRVNEKETETERERKKGALVRRVQHNNWPWLWAPTVHSVCSAHILCCARSVSLKHEVGGHTVYRKRWAWVLVKWWYAVLRDAAMESVHTQIKTQSRSNYGPAAGLLGIAHIFPPPPAFCVARAQKTGTHDRSHHGAPCLSSAHTQIEYISREWRRGGWSAPRLCADFVLCAVPSTHTQKVHGRTRARRPRPRGNIFHREFFAPRMPRKTGVTVEEGRHTPSSSKEYMLGGRFVCAQRPALLIGCGEDTDMGDYRHFFVNSIKIAILLNHQLVNDYFVWNVF